MKLVNVEEMRRIEQLADERGQSYAAMMEHAGQWVAQVAQDFRWPRILDHALVLVGPGNNGGDGLVAAHYLREAKCNVTLYIWKRDRKRDPNLARLKRRRRGVAILRADDDPEFANLRQVIRQTSLVIDALLGTGVARPLGGELADLLTVVKEELAALNHRSPTLEPFPDGAARVPLLEALGRTESMDEDKSKLDRASFIPGFARTQGASYGRSDPADLVPTRFAGAARYDLDDEPGGVVERLLAALPRAWPLVPVLAVDCPTGLNCDTGALDPAAVPASVTVTFAYPKWGQVQYPGAGACGILIVVDIGVPADLSAAVQVELVERSQVKAALPQRPRDANKGTFGKVMVAGGSLLYTGAPALSGSAAAHTGAGLVTLAIPREIHPILAGSLHEITWLPLPSEDGVHTGEGAERLSGRLKGYDALLVGPGLTTENGACQFLERLLSSGMLLTSTWRGRALFDADALNLLASTPDWQTLLPPHSILTPHPGEMSRLTGLSIDEINGNRIATARSFAAEWGHIVLLKGAHTVVAHPDGRASVLPFADPTLAKAGSGDVLAGAIAAMLAQGADPFTAATIGAFVHGLAGVMVGVVEGPAGVTARELLAFLPRALHDLIPEAA